MPSSAILRELEQLYKVSDRLDSLAEQHPLVAEALLTNLRKRSQYRNSIGGADCNENGAALRTRSRECLIFSSFGAFICGNWLRQLIVENDT
jgi:hypothetical protein